MDRGGETPLLHNNSASEVSASAAAGPCIVPARPCLATRQMHTTTSNHPRGRPPRARPGIEDEVVACLASRH
jgi:hypothetical protein